jgi:hypothetical protein
MNKQRIKSNKTWRTILISPEMKNWLMSEKARRALITYDQVLRQLQEQIK